LVSAVDNGLSDWVAGPWIEPTRSWRSVLPRLELMEDRKLLSTFVVTSLVDSLLSACFGDGKAVISARDRRNDQIHEITVSGVDRRRRG
jgi:hypothetical protein